MTKRHPQCIECRSETAPAEDLPGLVLCTSCGLLQIPETLDQPELPPLPEGGFEPQIPDFAEVFVGWRAWGIPAHAEDTVPRLYSVSHGQYFWEPREEIKATCNRKSSHEPPVTGCSCGLYSAKTIEHLQSMGYHYYDAEAKGMFHVIGSVSNWGKVREGDQGWRSLYSYPRELYVPFEAWELAESLTEAYGVPVSLKNILSNAGEYTG